MCICSIIFLTGASNNYNDSFLFFLSLFFLFLSLFQIKGGGGMKHGYLATI